MKNACETREVARASKFFIPNICDSPADASWVLPGTGVLKQHTEIIVGIPCGYSYGRLFCGALLSRRMVGCRIKRSSLVFVSQPGKMPERFPWRSASLHGQKRNGNAHTHAYSHGPVFKDHRAITATPPQQECRFRKWKEALALELYHISYSRVAVELFDNVLLDVGRHPLRLVVL